MARKLFVFLVIVAAGAGAYWFLIRGPGGPPDLSGLPPVQVDEARLTEAGKKEYKRLLRLAGRIRGASPARRFDLAEEVSWKLYKLGDYEGAIQWYLKLAEWFEELSPKQRKATERGQQGENDHTVVAATCHDMACRMCFLLGDEPRGVQVLEAFFRKYPLDSQGVFLLKFNYHSARTNPSGYREQSQKFKADPRFVKNAAK